MHPNGTNICRCADTEAAEALANLLNEKNAEVSQHLTDEKIAADGLLSAAKREVQLSYSGLEQPALSEDLYARQAEHFQKSECSHLHL